MVNIVIRIIIDLYAILMIVASFQSIHNNPKQSIPFHLINLFISLLILSTSFFKLKIFIIGSIIGIIGYQLTAIYRGISTNNLHIRHHIIRAVISFILITGLLLL